MNRAVLKKYLSAPGLLKIIRTAFEKISDDRSERRQYSLVDTLMSGLAVFGMKYPSLLQFDKHRQEDIVRHNLRTLYGVERAPCDTQLRTILDPLAPEALHGAYRAIHRYLQRHKVYEQYQYLDGYYLVSVDGTGQFASSQICCQDCCVKTKKQSGEESYYHQLLGAVMIHPDRRMVLPFAPEAITRQDGETKNDCERNAAKRLLRRLKQEHGNLKIIIVEDSLSGNGPHLQLLNELHFGYLIGVKAGDPAALWEAVEEKRQAKKTETWEAVDPQGALHRFEFVNEVPLNKTHPDLLVNYLEYWEIKEGKELHWSWITSITLSKDNGYAVMRGGRARWKVENETFNTLKNQGYSLEHNYGHGEQHLSTLFAYLMMLAFLVDQVQELCCGLFQRARQRFHARISLWERMRSLFMLFYIESWEIFWNAIIHRHVSYALQPDTS